MMSLLKNKLFLTAVGVLFAGALTYSFLEGYRGEKEGQAELRAVALIKEAVSPHQKTLTEALMISPQKIVPVERRILINGVVDNKDLGFKVYLNRYGEVRWHRDERVIGKTFDEYVKEYPTPTDAVEQAYIAKEPKARPAPDEPYFEVAMPLVDQGEVKGILLAWVEKP